MILGQTAAGPLALDLDRLIGSHMGIVANSGGGKSALIRKLLETTHGHVQHIILDGEDELYTLRERHDYVIAGGDGGDTVATPESAASLATAALTHGFSLICQLNDLGHDGANTFARNFIAAMIAAPRELWHPCLVVIDEAQRYDPMSLRPLTEAGRKRGFTAVIATQRLPKLDPNIRGDLNNWIMGRVGQALDRHNMADQLGMDRAGERALTKIEPRHFYAFGPALSRDPVLFRVDDVETTIVKPGQAKVHTPPPADALREILAGLAATEDKHDGPVCDSAQIGEMSAEIGRLNIEIADLKDREQRAYDSGRTAGIGIGLVRASQAIAALRIPQIANEIPAKGGGGPEVDDGRTEGRFAIVEPAPRTKPQRQRQEPREVTAGETAPMNAAARKMLDMLERIAPARVTWVSLAAMVGNKPRGGNFNAARKGLRESGLIIEDGDMICSAAPAADGMTRAEAILLWKDVLSNPAPRMIEVLASSGPLSKADLGGMLGIVPRGGNFNNGVAQLVRNGVAIDRGGVLHLADPLPGERP